MKILKKDISEIKENPNNPRYIKEKKFNDLVKSIKNFPEMLEQRPLVIDENNIVLGGNMRLKALKKLNYKKIPVIKVNNWTEDKKKEFIIKDNVGFGQWDFDILANEWANYDLNEWGIDLPKFDLDEDTKDLSDTINESFRVEVELDSEEEQEKLYNKLIDKGYICRLLTL